MFFVRLYFYVLSFLLFDFFCALCAFCLLCGFSIFSNGPMFVVGVREDTCVLFNLFIRSAS